MRVRLLRHDPARSATVDRQSVRVCHRDAKTPEQFVADSLLEETGFNVIDGNCHFVQTAGSRDRRCCSTCEAIMGRFSGRGDTGSPAGMASYEMGISAKTLENGLTE